VSGVLTLRVMMAATGVNDDGSRHWSMLLLLLSCIQ